MDDHLPSHSRPAEKEKKTGDKHKLREKRELQRGNKKAEIRKGNEGQQGGEGRTKKSAMIQKQNCFLWRKTLKSYLLTVYWALTHSIGFTLIAAGYWLLLIIQFTK